MCAVFSSLPLPFLGALQLLLVLTHAVTPAVMSRRHMTLSSEHMSLHGKEHTRSVVY